ncbi:MAG: M28 family peptidase, partial [Candidatus Aminicenantes bacterium]|nr:M28 family peptidase [Candidatus Aminicenantes bacterium]
MKRKRLKHKFLYGFLLLSFFSFMFLSSCAVAVKEGVRLSEEEKIKEAELLDSISEEKLLGYVKKLTSKDYAGRLTGTPEYKACARWMASLFEKWGLNPAGKDGTYLQSFPNPYTVVFVGGELSYTYQSRNARKKRKYVYEKEYYPGSNSGNGKLTAEVVYIGFGITAPELNYDDYAGVNVKGKIVLIEPEGPVSPDESPELYKEWKPYSSYQYKIKMAVAHGAKGMLINDLTVNADIDYVQNFMVAQVGEAVIKDIFTGTGKTHEEVMEKIKSTHTPQSFRTRKFFTIENFTEHHPKGTGFNVLGLIKGRAPLLKEEVIILGANLDHVGFCYEVMPGANDNASGVAVLLGVAEALARSPVKPKRSVLMIGFGSKEQSFKGSQTYLKSL